MGYEGYMFLESIFSMISGVVLIIFSIVVFYKKNDDNDESPAYKITLYIFVAIITTGNFLFSKGCFMMNQLMMQNSSMKYFRNLNLIYLSFVISCLSVAIFAKNSVINELKDIEKCKNHDWIKPIDEFNYMALKFLGTDKCPVQNYKLEYTQFFQQRQLVYIDSDTQGAKSIYDCTEFEIASNNYSNILKLYENQYNCGGMCTYQDYYIFSDILKRAPSSQSSCAQQIVVNFESKVNDSIILTSCATAYVFIHFLIAAYLQSKSYY